MVSDVVVIGSINMDLVVNAEEIPKIGETVIGKELLQIPGGKGANQAAAISKLKNDVSFLGKVGCDSFGDELLDNLKNQGVDIESIERQGDNSGIALINVDKDGNNNIVIIPGANFLVDSDYLNRNLDIIKKSKIVVFQLEIPIETVKQGLRLAKKYGKTTLLNPAPAHDLDEEIIELVDILVPNEHELERLSKVKISDDESLIQASKILLDQGIKKIIVTLGRKGVLYIDDSSHKFYDAYRVKPVDTTAAGDSFIGGFIASYLNHKNMDKAIDIGQATAALAIQKMGAQSSLPTLTEVEDFMMEVTR